MTRILEVVVAILLVALIYVAFALFLPSSRHVTHEIETLHPVRQVYDVLNSFRRFGDWHPMRALDPEIRYTREGEDRGVGARLRYESGARRIGNGSWEIVESEQDERIVYSLSNESYGENKRYTVNLESLGRKMKITWSYDVDYGWNIAGRLAGLYVSRTVGDDIKFSLGNLVSLLSTMPNHDYSGMQIENVVVAPTNVLFVSNNADRNITAVETATAEALELIARAISDNRLERAGPPRLITTNWGDTKYDFDIAVPVRLAGAGQAADAAEEGDDSAADGGASGEPAPLEPLPELRITNERVKVGSGYTGPAIMATYVGHGAALPLVRDMLRAFAAAHGEVITDRAFEEMLSDMATTQPEDSEYRVYWPVYAFGTGPSAEQIAAAEAAAAAAKAAADEAAKAAAEAGEAPAEAAPAEGDPTG